MDPHHGCCLSCRSRTRLRSGSPRASVHRGRQRRSRCVDHGRVRLVRLGSRRAGGNRIESRRRRSVLAARVVDARRSTRGVSHPARDAHGWETPAHDRAGRQPVGEGRRRRAHRAGQHRVIRQQHRGVPLAFEGTDPPCPSRHGRAVQRRAADDVCGDGSRQQRLSVHGDFFARGWGHSYRPAHGHLGAVDGYRVRVRHQRSVSPTRPPASIRVSITR